MNTKAIGEVSEAMVTAALMKRGHVVLRPIGDNQRYDLVLDDGGEFVRVQVKTGRLRNGVVEFHTCSSYAHRGRGKKTYEGDVEKFGIYCPETNCCYLIDVDQVGSARCALRVAPTKNNQACGVLWAKDFQI